MYYIMTFGIKKNPIHRPIGVKRAINQTTQFGTKALQISEFLMPEFIPEIEAAKAGLAIVDKLTRKRRK